jgi:aminoglycoside phosphotransferase (APT) family kinase protein
MTDTTVTTGDAQVVSASMEPTHITTSTRDSDELGRRIGTWMATKLPSGTEPTVFEVVKPEGNGLSSETLLFSARWIEGGVPTERQFVARIEPELDKIPVFPTYDLEMQFAVMRIIGQGTKVPVPETLWYEADARFIGAPFFVMARVDGRVPRDVLPYPFPDPNWVLDATPEERAHLQQSAVTALAGVHDITPDTHDLDFLAYDLPGHSSIERHLAWWEGYLQWVVGDSRSPLLDDCFAWLRSNLPVEGVDCSGPRLSWGDARIGNMMFDGFDVNAVLDWEMAAIGPAEIDLGWMAYLHLFFQDLATSLGAEGLPDFMQPADLAAAYEVSSGRKPGDLTWHIAYAAMRHGVVMRRVTERSILHGEAVRPDDQDDMIIHRGTLRAMLDGSYWATVNI